MRISSLEVVLNGGIEQNTPFIQYELPYSFVIVPELPSRTRYREIHVEEVEDVVSPPYKLPRIDSGRVGSPASQRTCPPRPDNISSEGSTVPISFGISEPPSSPVESHHLASPLEASMPSRRHHHAVNAARRNETADGRNVVVMQTNPRRGPMTGGTEIWTWGSDFPTDPMPLYARFGDNFARVVGVLLRLWENA